MLLTTGHELQGYQITEYIDVIFEEMLITSGLSHSARSDYDGQLLSSMGIDSLEATNQLHNAKQMLKNRMVEQAIQLGANALTGVCFSVNSIHDFIMVSMTATVVKVQKIAHAATRATTRPKDSNEVAIQSADPSEQMCQSNSITHTTQSFDVQSLLNTVSTFTSTKDIYAFIKQQAAIYPDLFDTELLHELEKCCNLERIYGAATGIETAVEYIKRAMQNVTPASENIPDFLSHVSGE